MKRIELILFLRGYTRDGISQALKLHRNTVRYLLLNIEKYRNMLVLEKLAELLDVPVDYLRGERDDRTTERILNQVRLILEE